MQPEPQHEAIGARTKQEPERKRFESREREAFVREPVTGVPWIALAQPQPRPELVDDGRGLVDPAVGGREQLDEVSGSELVQLLARTKLSARRRELVHGQAPGFVAQAARPASLEIGGTEARLVRARTLSEDADPRSVDIDCRSDRKSVV